MSDFAVNLPIDVEVCSYYLAEQSDPAANRYVFAYTVKIENKGDVPARLLGRHWIITDGDGNRETIQGSGVIGEQPKIEPGQAYQYTSGAILETPIGTMHGLYHMVDPEGQSFNADIKPFLLSTPNVLH